MSEARARYDFSGQVAIVTGGAAGIGQEIAAFLQAAGATVCSLDLSPSPEAGSVVADVTDLAGLRAAAQGVWDRWGRIDILVNNAGFAGPTMPLETYDPQLWRQVIEVDLIGVFNACHAIIPFMRRTGGGRIVNMASLAGKEGTPNSTAYSAAKAGVIALTKALGKELVDCGILVNAVAPAAVRTALLDQMGAEHVRVMVAKSPMKRMGEPREVAELVAWLCSASCSFSTGAVFDLSGGRATY